MAGPRVGIRFEGEDYVTPTVTKVKAGISGLAAQAKTSILTGFGLGAGIGTFNLLGGAVAGATGFIKDSISAASNLAESQSKVNVVFGQSADEITDWASTASKAFGQSKQQALEAAGTYGNLFQAFGVGRDESAKMSKALVELASDLASFNDTSVDDALIALRSGLSGETEPLKRYGIALSDARMRQELLSQGMTNLGATLTPLQKSTAAYALIMKDSALAQGDFARTSDGLANSQRSLDGEMADLSAEIGTALLPLMKDLVVIARDLVPVLSALLSPIVLLGKGVESAGSQINETGVQLGSMSKWGGVVTAAMREAAKPLEDELPSAAERGMAALKGTLERGKEDAIEVATETGEAIPKATADGILAGQQKLADAGAQLVEFMKQALTPAQIVARDQGFLASKELAAGLASNNPLVQQKARELRDAALAELKTTPGYYTGGYNIGQAWALGLITSLQYYRYKILHELYFIKANMIGASPPPQGPLRTIDKGGFNIGKAWAEGFGKGSGLVKVPALPGMVSGGGMSLAPSGTVSSGVRDVHIHIDQGAFIDGPSLDLLTHKIATRLRFAPGT